MDGTRHRWLAGMALFGACGLMNAVLAAPPGRAAAHWDNQAPLGLHAPLDLHLPAAAAFAPQSSAQSSANFPSALHRPTLGAQQQIQLPALGADTQQAHIESHMEELARRVHREGVPVARLWENKSALVSLGLNQRGKPGLWLVQKIH
jgi:hypothetical protein